MAHLRRAGVGIGTLVVLGGEPTLFAALLARALRSFKAVAAADRIEVVSNGLTPQGLTLEALEFADRFTISVYVETDEILVLWRAWLARVAPHVELCLRRNEEGWDQWIGDLRVPPERAQEMFEGCWYRKHCVTLERGRLFLCSRIAKLAREQEGLPIDGQTTAEQVWSYLGRTKALDSCATCVPMMGLPPVRPGVQPDDRIAKLEQRARTWLRLAVENTK